MKARALFAAFALWVAFGAIDTRTRWNATQPIFAAPTLSDLKSVDELKALFNQDRGKPRLVLLLFGLGAADDERPDVSHP